MKKARYDISQECVHKDNQSPEPSMKTDESCSVNETK